MRHVPAMNVPQSPASQFPKLVIQEIPPICPTVANRGARPNWAKKAEGTPPYRNHHTVLFQLDIIPRAGWSTRLT